MGPGDIYILLIVVTALAVAPFSALARIVVLAWIVAHVAWIMGVPEGWANLAGHLIVMALAARHLRCVASAVVWGLSVVLVVIDAAHLMGRIDNGHAWWAVLSIALVQLVALPFAIDRETLTGVAKVWHRGQGGGLLRTRST